MIQARAFLAATLFAAAASAAAQQPAYTLTVPDTAGSPVDRAARVLGEALVSVKAASSVTVENPAGAPTAALARFVKEARGPQALLLAGQDLLAAAEFDSGVPRVQDASPLARLAVGHFAIFVPAGSPHASMADLSRAFKADPGSIAWDAGAKGSVAHLFVAFLARTVGADAARVRLAPAGGAGATAGVAPVREALAAMREGRVRVLAVTAPSAVSGVRSLKEQGVNLVFGQWVGLFAGPGLKPTHRDDLLLRVKAATETPAWKALLAERGWSPAWQQGSDYARFLDEESRSLGYLARSLGLATRR